MIRIINASTGQTLHVYDALVDVVNPERAAIDALKALCEQCPDWHTEVRAVDENGRILAKLDAHGDVYRWHAGRWEMVYPSKWWMTPGKGA